MADVNLSEKIPPNARWVKLRFEMKRLLPAAQLKARVWSGAEEGAVILEGESGDAFVKLDRPQTLSYQKTPDVDLKLKVVAYKVVDGGQ